MNLRLAGVALVVSALPECIEQARGHKSPHALKGERGVSMYNLDGHTRFC